MGIGAGIFIGLSAQWAQKCPNFLTRTLRWLTDKWV